MRAWLSVNLRKFELIFVPLLLAQDQMLFDSLGAVLLATDVANQSSLLLTSGDLGSILNTNGVHDILNNLNSISIVIVI